MGNSQFIIRLETLNGEKLHLEVVFIEQAAQTKIHPLQRVSPQGKNLKTFGFVVWKRLANPGRFNFCRDPIEFDENRQYPYGSNARVYFND